MVLAGQRYIWPQCTVGVCRCERSWGTRADAHLATERYRGKGWTDDHGYATCRCHTEAGFPCDRWIRNRYGRLQHLGARWFLKTWRRLSDTG